MKRLNKSAVIRARCAASLKQDIERVAYFQQLDAADIIRIACSRYVAAFSPQTPQAPNQPCAN